MAICWARRSGKDVTIFNWVIKKLMQQPCSCYYVFPSYAQAKKVLWDGITSDGVKIIDFIPKEIISHKNNQEMKIRLTSGSLLQLVGSDNIDSLMGTNPKIVVFSEYALQDPQAWDFIRPILKVNGGVAIFISTPRGRNHFWDLYRHAQGDEQWFAQKLTIDDTKVLTPDDIEQERKEGMSEELIQQEYYCSFDRGVEGSYYSKLLLKMREQERIVPLTHDPYRLVHTSWDLGWDDFTSVIYFQIVAGNNLNIIDCDERGTTTLSQWKQILMDKGYKYGTHLFPHDVEHVDGLGSGCTRKEILEDLGIPVTTVQKSLVADGIEAVKAILSSRVSICSNKCGELIKSLENYHRIWDEKHKVYGIKPHHNFASHYADSIRYLAQGLSKIDSGGSDPDSDSKALRNYWG